MVPSKRRRPPQRGQASTSTSNARRMRYAQKITEPVGQAQYPLADRHVRQDVVHETCGTLGHAPASAARAEAAPHELWQAVAIGVPRGCIQERLQMFVNHAKQHAVLGGAGLIRGKVGLADDVDATSGR